MPDARVSNTITGRDAFLRLWSDEGVTKMFGNPGTTELPIMHALSSAPEMGYVLALQEAIVIAMADGYARVSGKLVSCNVHVAPGLGNAIGSIYTSFISGTPMIVTAGQQEQGHGLTEPLLYAPLIPIATPVVKWATEVNRIEDLPRILRRAAKVATTAPTGPVFISLPGDILNNDPNYMTFEFMTINTPNSGSDTTSTCLPDPVWVCTSGSPMHQTARSRHPGGINALFCDGSVQFVNDSITLATWRALSTMNGGETIAPY